ncbi:hypothetical protein H4R33_007024 [Dimargaris cristalligena]|nr:hypothetical protein H4R33_007024 [Dimargaris cristalligena]
MKVASVYTKAIFVAVALLLVAPQATAAPGLAEAEQALLVTKRGAISPPEARALLTGRHRSFSSRSVRARNTLPR